MITLSYNDIVTPELLKGTLDHNAHTGFLEDYRVLSCLLKTVNPKTVFEVGTNIGSGVNVIGAAVPGAKIYSLDLDFETMKANSKQYPIGTKGEDRVGSAATVPYNQIRGDSRTFDYRKYPCEAYFIDGEHDKEHVIIESFAAMSLYPKIIIWHDADMPEVMEGIQKSFEMARGGLDLFDGYSLYKVKDTRIAFMK